MNVSEKFRHPIGTVITGLTILSMDDEDNYRVKHTHKVDKSQGREPCNEFSTIHHRSIKRREKRNVGATCIKCRNRRPNRTKTRDVGCKEADTQLIANAFKDMDKFSPLIMADHNPRETMTFIWCDNAAIKLPGRIKLDELY